MVLSFDIEDGISLSIRDSLNISLAPTERVDLKTNEILDSLLIHQKKATFFVVGQVAEHYPSLVKRIVEEGHDLGSHSYSHEIYFKLNDKQLDKELKLSKNVLEQISGKKVIMHRAPQFSISSKNRKVLNMVLAAGYEIDSSVVAGAYKTWGWSNFPKGISKLKMDGGELIEVPIPLLSNLFPIPTIGGTYLKFIPVFILKRILNYNSNNYNMLYLHPYEFDSISRDLYRYYLGYISFKHIKFSLKTILYWLNRSSVKRKLEYILKNQNGIPISELINSQVIVSRNFQTLC